METQPVLVPLSQKLRVPADVVFITLPLLCWALIAFRWCGLWLTEPWMVGVTVLYYAMAAAYLVFTVMVRMRVVEIVGLFLLLVACIVIWLPYHWVLAVLLVPALFMAFYKRAKKVAAIVLAAIAGFIVFLILIFPFTSLTPEKYAYHPSPDGRYTALEYAFTLVPSGTDVCLCRVYGPLLVEERVLYLANYSDFGGKIEWLDDSTILIYGDKMDVFEDPEIKNYDYF